MAGIKVIGNASQLLAFHGEVDTHKALSTISQSTELTLIDISDINKASETGGLYVMENGEMLDEYDDFSEKEAKYKIVPTGLFHKYSNRPLFASFCKSKGVWKGVYIATAEKLFDMYSTFYNSPDFVRDYVTHFCGENENRAIRAFGLKAILEQDSIVYSDDSDEANMTVIKKKSRVEECEKSLEKLRKSLNSGKKSRSDKVKIQRRIDRMEKELIKAKKAEGIVDAVEKPVLKELVVEKPVLKEQVEESDVGEVNEEPMVGDKEQVEESTVTSDDKNEEDKEMPRVKTAETPVLEVEHLVVIKSEETVEEKPKKKRGRRKKEDILAEQALKAMQEKVQEENIEVPVEVVVEKEKVTTTVVENTKAVEEVVETTKVEAVEVKAMPVNVEVPVEKTVEKVKSDYVSIVGQDGTGEIKPELSVSEAKQLHDISVEIYNKLLYKENFADNNFRRLSFYIKGMLIYLDTKKGKTVENRGTGYVYSEDKRKLLFNTNLIDTYGNFIYVIDHTPNTTQYFKKRLSIMQSKTGLIEEGFKLEDIRKLPGTVQFVKDPRDCVFTGKIDDFDLEDDEHLNHIINERRMRFPDSYKDVSCKNICDKLKTSIEQAIRISEIDHRYIVPLYNIVHDEVEFMIPFHLDTHYGQRPELAIIIANKRGLWKIFTVLHVEDAYDNARLLCNHGNTWLSI